MFKRQKKQRHPVCLAPYNSLFFSMNGQVYFCLANQKMLLGVYPEDSVKAIIEGHKAKEFRSQFQGKDLPPSCYQCQQHLDSHTASSAFIQFHKAYPPNQENFPRYIDFELDNRCNLKCIMCRPYFSSAIPLSDGSPGNYSTPYDEAFFSSFDAYIPHLMKAHFRGGEPFIIKKYHDFWERLISLNPNIRIGATTNGSILPERVAVLLKKGNFDINISLDSLKKESWEKIRCGGNFDTFLKNINHLISLKKSGKIRLSACICLMWDNNKEIPSLFEFCNKHDIAVYINYVEVPQYLSLKQGRPEKIQFIIDTYIQEAPIWNKNDKQPNQGVYETLIRQLGIWKEGAASQQQDEYNSSNFLKAKEVFINKLNEYKAIHPEKSMLDIEIIEKKIELLRTHEIDGVPLEFVLFDFIKMESEIVFSSLVEMKEDDLNRKILEKYFHIVNTIRYHDYEPPGAL